MLKLPENTILEKLKKGDRKSFCYLYDLYFQRLYVFACKFVDEEQAKDFVQDCFIELWQKREKIDIISSFSAYLFTIIKNKCYSHLKQEQKRQKGRNNFGLMLKEKELQFFMNSEKSILEFDIKDRVGKLIKRLPDKCCEVFKDSRFEGLSNKEIAVKQHISVKMVEKHMSKALKLFREEFKDLLTVLVTIFLSSS